MPQMAPLSWTLIFMFFILTYTLTSAKVYYTANPIFKQTKTMKQMNKKTINWKW